MPISHSVALFNKRVTNRITAKLATRMPGFGVVVHCGRKSGRIYRTPVNIFRREHKYVVALTYGPKTDWVRNVLASGGCVLETGGRKVQLRRPRLFRDVKRGLMPPHVRVVLGLTRVYDFLELTPDASREMRNEM